MAYLTAHFLSLQQKRRRVGWCLGGHECARASPSDGLRVTPMLGSFSSSSARLLFNCRSRTIAAVEPSEPAAHEASGAPRQDSPHFFTFVGARPSQAQAREVTCANAKPRCAPVPTRRATLPLAAGMPHDVHVPTRKQREATGDTQCMSNKNIGINSSPAVIGSPEPSDPLPTATGYL